MSASFLSAMNTRAEDAVEVENTSAREGVWSVLVEYPCAGVPCDVGSDTYVFKTEAEADKWREAALECAEQEVVYHVIFIPFRTFEESMEKFCADHDRESDDENYDWMPDSEESEECVRCEKTFRYYLHDATCDDCSSYFVCKDCEMLMEGCGICGKIEE
jgi:hypothetical protein